MSTFTATCNLHENSFSRDSYGKKKWIRCKEGIERYSMGRTKFTELAREAGAVLKIDKTLLIDVDAFERYMESFRIPGEN